MAGPLSGILHELDRCDIPYCILHGWEDVDRKTDSDLDIAVFPQDLVRVEEVLRSIDGHTVVQLLQHESTGYYFVIAVRDSGTIQLVRLDVATDYRRNGHILLSSAELLEGRQKRNGLWTAAPSVELSYLLLKKLLKGSMRMAQQGRLKALAEQLGEDGQEVLSRLFKGDGAGRALHLLREGGWDTLAGGLGSLRSDALRCASQRYAAGPRYWAPEIARRWRRIRSPSGLFVAVMGPDGVGKSTLIRGLSRSLRGAFRRVDSYHLRPRLMGARSAAGEVRDPHEDPPYGPLSSLAKLGYLLLDYMLGGAFALRPKLARSSLLLFDRYFHDILADPLRFRYGGARWPARFVGTLVPWPDLFLFLDAPEDVISSRRPEVPRVEIARQRTQYHWLAAELPNAVTIRASLDETQVLSHASEVILQFLGQRYQDRRRDWLPVARSAFANPLLLTQRPSEDSPPEKRGQKRATYAALSLKGGRRFLVPLDRRRVSTQALQMYRPQRTGARMAKALVVAGMKMGVLQPLLRRKPPDAEPVPPPMRKHLADILGQSLHLAVSLGTPGDHQKPVLQAMDSQGTVVAYVKVGWNEPTKDLVRREAAVLAGLETLPLRTFLSPKVVYVGEWEDRLVLVQSPPHSAARPGPRTFTPLYGAALAEMRTLRPESRALEDCAFWRNLVSGATHSPHRYCREVLMNGINHVSEVLRGQKILCHLSHGDFAPWNAAAIRGRLFLFDWEYADWAAPAGYDAFHFQLQTGTLVDRQPPAQVYRTLCQGGIPENLGIPADRVRAFLLLYLLTRVGFLARRTKVDLNELRRLSAMVDLCVFEAAPP